MPLREQIERLGALPDADLKQHADEAEDVVQRGLAAVLTGELWLSHLRRERARAIADADGRAEALEAELRTSERSTAAVREEVTALAARAQALGIGAPAARA